MTEFTDTEFTESNSLSRSKAALLFDHKYFPIPTSGLCFYCGQDAQTGDHVPPLSQARKRAPSSPFWLVPSCQRCNHLLGTHSSQNLATRCKYLHRKIVEKGGKIDVPSHFGRIDVWIMPPVAESDRDLMGHAIEAISGGALEFIEGKLGACLRRSYLSFNYHRNEKISRGIVAGMLGRSLKNERFLWGFGAISSTHLPDPFKADVQ